ncbi:MAG: hypothetical protein HFE63_11275 [Clostridiales bacterium]|nr:hypothetical protein [Clostridiales bacterium]
MKKIRLLSAFLTVVMVFGMLSALPVFAEDEEPLVPGLDPDTNLPTINYITQVYATPEDKLATMTKYLDNGGYELYVEPISGEIAYVNKATGQIIFSNPYDVSQTGASESIKGQLLSQIRIKYTDNNSELDLFSFQEACQRGQIKVKKIKNGVRVEYVMGREETRKLVPKQINAERFQELIMANIPEGTARSKMEAFYQLKDPFDPDLTERAKNELIATFPICSEMAIYIFDPYASDRELNQIEGYIKTYCPEYTYETLEEDHTITQYEGTDAAPVLFRLSLEYSLSDDGSLNVRLPANGIRFDESSFSLSWISMLPYFGAGSGDYSGYTFFPDGSGALVRFEDIGSKPLTLSGRLYGEDYAYQQVSGQHREVMRMPVYGIVETNVPVAKTVVDPESKVESVVYAEIKTADGEPYEKKTNGFLAIIEEGDALAQISTDHGGTTHKYNTVYTTFSPRPKDSYNLAEAISVGQNATYTVVSERKYTGSYRIKYIMLTDDELAAESGVKDYYEASYVGMAKAYRDYLKDKGILSDLTDVKDSIPLYIESFGCMEDIERILSIPVEVLKPLTTFDDLKDMYTKLSEAGITNVNYKLTGYANGGMNDTAPYNVKFEKVVGGNKGFTEFVEYANANNIGVYPDFDFANIGMFEMFDGVSMRKHLVKTMDNRYTSKRYYDSTLQSFVRGYSLAVSPSVFSYFYDHFNEKYSALNPNGISVATLGTDLNSDFDKKDPYNREDSKEFTVDLLKDIKENQQNVMIEGGNAYALQYADHILNVSLDSSRYSNASESVPFVGMVLHGSMNFAGTAINMAGDTQYEFLKAIENGASLYFTLSMQNTSLLKEDVEFNKYYSVSFDIWYDEVVSLYDELNEIMAGLQTKKIVGHEFLIGERVPSAEEIAADKIAAEEAKKAADEAAKLAAEKAEKAEKLAQRLGTTAPSVTTNDEAEETTTGYNYTKYTSDDGRIVKVTYEGGKSFILNYNNFEITVEDNGKTYTIGALDFVAAK